MNSRSANRLTITPPPANGKAPGADRAELPAGPDQAAPTGDAGPRHPLLVDSHEAARLLAVSERTLWALTDAGEVRCLRLGRAKRYAVAELERFIARRMEGE